MSYTVVKNIKGRQYLYRQRTYREGGRVRTESMYIGPVGGSLRKRKKSLACRVVEFVEAQGPIFPVAYEKAEDMAAKQASEEAAAKDKAAESTAPVAATEAATEATSQGEGGSEGIQ